MSDLRLERIRWRWMWIGIGLLALVGVLLPGAYRLGWRPLPMRVEPPLPILYLAQDSAGFPQLFRADVRGANITTTQLTSIQNATLLDFALSPTGFPVALSVETTAGGEIWLLREGEGEIKPLLDCPQAECSSPVWSPDGRRLIYERRERSGGEGVAGRPHLWWLDTGTGETIPVLEDDHSAAQNARFSPDGAWLSYAVPAEQGIEVYNLDDGRHFLLPSQVGAAATWSQDSQSLLFPELELITYHGSEDSDHSTHSHEFEEVIALYSANVESATREEAYVRLSPAAGVDDASSAWSPDGQWIAFGRKTPRTQNGRQLWLMRPDGSEARALTDEPNIQHGMPHWSPDGRYLLFQRFALFEPNASPEVWIMNVESGEMQQVVKSGYLPNWLP